MLTLRDLIEQPPLIHNNRSITWGIRPALAQLLDEAIGPRSVTLETGAGLSTLVILRKRPRQHTAVQPVPDEFAVILQFAERHQLDIHTFLPIVARSQDWLPRAELPDLDFVLVDGAHAFPVPFIDWYYGAEKLKVGGLMAVDDTHLVTGTILADFMDVDPRWEPVVRDDASHFAVYRKRVHPVHDDDWTRQPYVHNAYPTESIRLVRGVVAGGLPQPPAPVELAVTRQRPEVGILNQVDESGSQVTIIGASGDHINAPGLVDYGAESSAGDTRIQTKDFTKAFDYEQLLREEKEHYSQIEVTEDLKEGGAHASSCWHHYWGRVAKIIGRSEFADMPGYLSRTFGQLERPIEILSLGSGYCGHELALARGLRGSYRIRCTDINERLFARARQIVQDEGLAMEFAVADLNFMTIEPKRYHLILAHAVLHHVINLEHLFEQVAAGLANGGVFHLVDVAGQNRKLIWDANERLMNALLETGPRHISRGLQLDIRAEAGGMEGIRQADIVPQLRMVFTPLFEYQHGAFIRFICTNPELSPRLSLEDEAARRYLNFLIDVDDASVRHGVLRPLEIWGVYRPRVQNAEGVGSNASPTPKRQK
jgi:predicted O-methyltransferase YrrM